MGGGDVFDVATEDDGFSDVGRGVSFVGEDYDDVALAEVGRVAVCLVCHLENECFYCVFMVFVGCLQQQVVVYVAR